MTNFNLPPLRYSDDTLAITVRATVAFLLAFAVVWFFF
jgi:hypothetical protein